MPGLSLSYTHDRSYFEKSLPRDDFGWLEANIVTSKVSANAGFWVQWQDIQEFGEALPTDKKRLTSSLAVDWGSTDAGIYTPHIAISLSPKGDLGEILVAVELSDFHEPTSLARATFRATYSAIEIFKEDIVRLLACQADKAELLGH